MVFNLSGTIAGVPICLPTCFFRLIILFAKIALVFPPLCSGKQFLIFEGGCIEIDLKYNLGTTAMAAIEVAKFAKQPPVGAR